jgi:hypothetical protein
MHILNWGGGLRRRVPLGRIDGPHRAPARRNAAQGGEEGRGDSAKGLPDRAVKGRR